MVNGDVVECTEATVDITVKAENGDETKYEVKKTILLTEVFNSKFIEKHSYVLAWARGFSHTRLLISTARLCSRQGNRGCQLDAVHI